MILSATYGLDFGRILTQFSINVQHNLLKVLLRIQSGCTNTFWCMHIKQNVRKSPLFMRSIYAIHAQGKHVFLYDYVTQDMLGRG